jgi:hypothetical protein
LGVEVLQDDARSLPGLEDNLVTIAAGGSQAPVIVKAMTKIHVYDAVNDRIDSDELRSGLVAIISVVHVPPLCLKLCCAGKVEKAGSSCRLNH